MTTLDLIKSASKPELVSALMSLFKNHPYANQLEKDVFRHIKNNRMKFALNAMDNALKSALKSAKKYTGSPEWYKAHYDWEKARQRLDKLERTKQQIKNIK